MTEDPLAGFAVAIEVPVAWGEMDAFGHVDNTVFFRYFESARYRIVKVVAYDYGAGRKAAIPAAVRERILALGVGGANDADGGT